MKIIGLVIFIIVIIGAWINFKKHNQKKALMIEHFADEVNTEVKNKINNIKNK